MDAVATPAPAAAPPPLARPRRPWLAGVLSLVLPGLGHLYAGRGRRGLALWAVWQVSAVAALALSMAASSPLVRLGSLALLPVLYLGIAADAYGRAAAVREGFVPRRFNRWYVYLGVILLANYGVGPLLFVTLRETVARAYKIPSPSMEPSLLVGDYLLAAPMRGEIERGMPVVFHSPAGDIQVVSRLVGLPGDTLQMRGKILFLNGVALEEPYVRHLDPVNDPSDDAMLWQADHLAAGVDAQTYRPTRDEWGPIVVPEGMYFTLGDSRDNSWDGRYWGFVPRENVTKRPVWIYFSREPMGGVRWSRLGMGIR